MGAPLSAQVIPSVCFCDATAFLAHSQCSPIPAPSPTWKRRRYHPRWLMGFDRLGRPIVATQYGSFRLWEMTKLTTVEKMGQLHAREQELLLRVLRRRSLSVASWGRDRGVEEATTGTATEGRGERSSAAAADSAAERPHIVDTIVLVVDTAELTLRHVSTAVHGHLGRSVSLKLTEFGNARRTRLLE